jgi:ABC-type ATPase with predicted acetyltransferase domain
MQTCSTGKRVYQTEQQAMDALLEAYALYEYRSGGGPVSVYQCDDCGCFHFTSKGNIHPVLAEHLKSNQAKTSQEAARWLNKLKRK